MTDAAEREAEAEAEASAELCEAHDPANPAFYSTDAVVGAFGD